MKRRTRVLVLTADTGFGHRNAARAIVAALEATHGAECECAVRSMTSDRRVPSFVRSSQRNYDNTVRNNRALYWLTYAASESPLRGAVSRILTALLQGAIRDIVAEQKPDVIISTYHLYNGPIAAGLAEISPRPAFFTVVTDLANVHRFWFQSGSRAYFVSTEEAREQALAAGLPAERVVLSGIPIDPQFAAGDRDKATLRASLGWDPELPTLLAVGSRRMRRLVENLDYLNNHYSNDGTDNHRPGIQLAVVAGGDDTLYRQLKAIDWRIPAQIYGYVDEIPAMMGAADVLMSKAGGLILAEALARGLPTILIDAIPGQESGNASYIARHGAGLVARRPAETLRALDRWLRDERAELGRVAENARRIGHPNAASCVAESIWRSVSEAQGSSPAANT